MSRKFRLQDKKARDQVQFELDLVGYSGVGGL